jgi:DNA-binding NarL/FixJ family response regulator
MTGPGSRCRLKNVVPAVLHQGIRAVGCGDAVLTLHITRGLVDRFAPIAPWPHDDTAGALLKQPTAREKDVFALITAGLTDAETAEHVFLTRLRTMRRS